MPALAARIESGASVAAELAPQRAELLDRAADRGVDPGLDLQRRAVRLGGEAVVAAMRQAGEDGVDPVRQRPADLVEQHHLLLDPDRVGAELVRLGPGRPGRQRAGAPRSRHLAVAAAPRADALVLAGLDEAARKALFSWGRWTSVSACHWTPIRNCRPGSSIASIVPSGRARRHLQPLAEPVDRLVVEGVDVERVGDPHLLVAEGPARRLPGSISTGWLVSVPGVVCRCGICSESSGRCWCRAPPRTTLSAWVPRQIARIGISRASARRATASSKRSRSGSVGPSSACGSAP